MTTAKRPRTFTADEEAHIRKNFGWRADAIAELDAERLISDELAAAQLAIKKAAERLPGICTNLEHKPLRFPLCARCQLEARIEEGNAALARWEGK